jgi:putative ABC transport system permease protein
MVFRGNSMPPLRHIISTLYRQRLMPALVVLQIALACAILVNALFLLGQQLAPMLVSDGIAKDQVLLVEQLVSRNGQWRSPRIEAGAQALRALPGVRAVTPALGLPMKQTMMMTYALKSADGASVTASAFAGEGMLQTLGLDLEQGRDFVAADYADLDLSANTGNTPTVPLILTTALARKLFPEGDALGGTLRDADAGASGRYVVVGIVRHLLRYQVDALDDGKAEYSVLVPSRITGTPILTYAVRTDPAQRDAVHAAIPDLLKHEFGNDLMPEVDVRVDDYESLRRDAFKPRRAAIWLLATVCTVVTFITLVGIASLTGYWVSQRTRQIGIRRALGATRGQILHYFQIENLTLTGIALLIGMPLAYATNQWLMHYYELPRLPLHYLPIGAGVLWLLGQMAVYGPARRAAAVPPAVAARTV